MLQEDQTLGGFGSKTLLMSYGVHIAEIARMYDLPAYGP